MIGRIILGIGMSVFLTTVGLARDPMGEKAHYKLDKTGKRTSSIVREGVSNASVVQKVENPQLGTQYKVQVDYNMNILLAGRQQGSEILVFPAEYFTPEFLEKLRKDKHYQTPDFKVKHEGFADAKNMDGKFYRNCDQLFIYDIRLQPNGFWQFLGNAFSMALNGAHQLDMSADVEEMTIRGLVSYGTPVLGAVKLDIETLMSGVRVKTGFDYMVPK